MTKRGLLVACLLALLFLCPATGRADDKQRRVYVVHSGMHLVLSNPDKDRAAKTLRRQLLDRGIPQRDIVMLENPFPTASWSNPVPREGLIMYLEAMNPASEVSHDFYLRLHRALQKQGVSKDDEIIWIGHSAGGQVGMTMAHLAHNLTDHPDLAKSAAPYRFGMVVTLGSPIGSNHVPTEVKLRHYHSPADTVVGLLARNGAALAGSLGYPIVFGPCCDLGDNAKVRVFDGIEHPSWNVIERVLDRILSEDEPLRQPAWSCTHAECRPGLGLTQLLSQALEAECRICLEELPRR